MDDNLTSERSISYSQPYEQAKEELSRHLPPWSASNHLERCKTVTLYMGIWLPVVILVFLLVSSYSLYIAWYIYPLVTERDDEPELYYWHSEEEQQFAKVRGWVCFAIMTWSFVWFLCSHYQAVFTSPGRVPRTSDWMILSDESSENSDDRMKERRRDGSTRTCSHCQLKKPDRTHHCKQCEACNLRMDHHCNWIANCVGFCNYKHFFLMTGYGAIMLAVFIGSFWECVVVNLGDQSTSTTACYVILLMYSLLCLLGTVEIPFFFFHVWLVWNNFSTIEYCEKKKANDLRYQQSPFNKGVYRNFKEALGDTVWAWPFPFCYRKTKEDGLYY